MPTNEERREIAESLRLVSDRRKRNKIVHITDHDFSRNVYDATRYAISKAVDPYEHLADLIEPEPERSCTFAPEAYRTAFSEDGLEYGTDDPAGDCLAFLCSECGSAMMYGEGGWFDTKPPYKPAFSYCPYCGARVVSKDGD